MVLECTEVLKLNKSQHVDKFNVLPHKSVYLKCLHFARVQFKSIMVFNISLFIELSGAQCSCACINYWQGLHAVVQYL